MPVAQETLLPFADLCLIPIGNGSLHFAKVLFLIGWCPLYLLPMLCSCCLPMFTYNELFSCLCRWQTYFFQSFWLETAAIVFAFAFPGSGTSMTPITKQNSFTLTWFSLMRRYVALICSLIYPFSPCYLLLTSTYGTLIFSPTG